MPCDSPPQGRGGWVEKMFSNSELQVFTCCMRGLNLCGAVHMFKTRPSMKTLLNTEKKKVTTSVLC